MTTAGDCAGAEHIDSVDNREAAIFQGLYSSLNLTLQRKHARSERSPYNRSKTGFKLMPGKCEPKEISPVYLLIVTMQYTDIPVSRCHEKTIKDHVRKGNNVPSVI